MRIHYLNKQMEKILVGINAFTAAAVISTYICLFGFDRPLLAEWILYSIQVVLLGVFVVEKIVRFSNSVSKSEFFKANWFEIPFFAILVLMVFGAGRWFGKENPGTLRHMAVGIYLVVQVVTKVCRSVVNLAASGKNPTRVLIATFLVLILAGAGVLCLPRSASGANISIIDSLFTATSATCVTGLVVRDTGGDFSLMGQIIILTMIQLGGLGIVVFGAVFALLLGQALSLRESVAMGDLLSANTLSRIGKMIAFIFFGTMAIEAVGAICMLGMWEDVPGGAGNIQHQWFYSIFHSISSFCNAGFSLFSDSFTGYSRCWQIYAVVCPLIILGGLGFGVLYDISYLITDKIKRFFKLRFKRNYRLSQAAPKRMRLQSKIVLCISALLIILGTVGILVFEHYSGANSSAEKIGVPGAFFQSVTARTAGFNTVKISAMSAPSKFVLMLLMFVGGSPGSTAGGIKTVTLAVIIMTVITALRKRTEVEMFNRSVRLVVVGKAITVTLLFVLVLFGATMLLTVTESSKGFAMSDIMFETSSALGTVGLTSGITGDLTWVGKLIIIIVMLIGRLGPLTLLAVLTFDLKPIRYNYPEEAIIVG